jgi:hypothetical protein
LNAGIQSFQAFLDPGFRRGGGVVDSILLNLTALGWDTVTDENLWSFSNENKIKEFMSATVRGVSGIYVITAGLSKAGSPLTLTKYVWEYLGNQIPCEIYGTCGGDTTSPAGPTSLTVG